MAKLKKKSEVLETKLMLEEDDGLFDLKKFCAGISAIPPGNVTAPSKNYTIKFKGSGHHYRMSGKWGEINLPRQDTSFMALIDSMKVYHGKYEFFKEYNFKGEKLSLSEGEKWTSRTFRIRQVKSWRSV